MNRKHASLMGIVAGSIVAVFYGCADEGATSGHDELLSTEDSIFALRASGQEAQDAAKACFETFKTCEASAAAGDTACRDQLKACLPDAPPAAAGCGAGHGGERGDGGASRDAGVVPEPTTGGAGRGARQDDASDRGGRGAGDGGGAREAGTSRADAGAARTGGQGAFGGQGQGGGFGQAGQGQERGRGEPRGCGFDFPAGAMGGCRDEADRSMSRGMGCDGARAQHQSCVAHSFDESLAKLCKKATELCAQQAAQADVCARLTSACSAVPQSDAGAGPRPDAGN